MPRYATAAFLLLLGAASPRPAVAQGDPIAEIKRLTAEAMTAFDAYSYRKGRLKLEQALQHAQRKGVHRSPQLAETYLLLGVAAVSGGNDVYRGLHYFAAALRLDPKSSLPKKVVTPQLSQVFQSAQQAVRVVGKPPALQIKGPGRPVETDVDPILKAGDGRGLVHVPIDDARRGYALPVKAAAGDDVRVHRMFLFYRPAGTVTFLRVQMARSGSFFRAAIPVEATKGRYLHYYIEARDPRGAVAASNGNAGSPNVVTIK